MNWKKYLLLCNEIAKESVAKGNTPFGALIIDEEGNILLKQGNVELTEQKATGHAETQIVERASQMYSKDFLHKCTLVTSVEPCVMCSGATYWANIGRVVFGLLETDLLALTGDNEINPTLNLSCREVFRHGQKDIEVIGPFEDLKEELIKVHKDYWR
ncbi:MAG: nucleoside deaminase [Tissierellia bacterium]|nr:nucleoside deaminase [Tissierellia bacterium]